MKIQRISNEEKIYQTCFNDGITFRASTDEIIEKLGEPDFRDEPTDKVTREWDMELEDGTPFTIYDWKEYREYEDDQKVYWNVGNDFRDKESKGKIVEALAEIGFTCE